MPRCYSLPAWNKRLERAYDRGYSSYNPRTIPPPTTQTPSTPYRGKAAAGPPAGSRQWADLNDSDEEGDFVVFPDPLSAADPWSNSASRARTAPCSASHNEGPIAAASSENQAPDDPWRQFAPSLAAAAAPAELSDQEVEDEPGEVYSKPVLDVAAEPYYPSWLSREPPDAAPCLSSFNAASSSGGCTVEFDTVPPEGTGTAQEEDEQQVISQLNALVLRQHLLIASMQVEIERLSAMTCCVPHIAASSATADTYLWKEIKDSRDSWQRSIRHLAESLPSAIRKQLVAFLPNQAGADAVAVQEQVLGTVRTLLRDTTDGLALEIATLATEKLSVSIQEMVDLSVAAAMKVPLGAQDDLKALQSKIAKVEYGCNSAIAETMRRLSALRRNSASPPCFEPRPAGENLVLRSSTLQEELFCAPCNAPTLGVEDENDSFASACESEAVVNDSDNHLSALSSPATAVIHTPTTSLSTVSPAAIAAGSKLCGDDRGAVSCFGDWSAADGAAFRYCCCCYFFVPVALLCRHCSTCCSCCDCPKPTFGGPTAQVSNADASLATLQPQKRGQQFPQV